jgi:hypothetical protein
LEHIRAFASKAAEHAARIAGVLTLWGDLHAPMLTPQAMGWGIEIAQFYLSEARRLSEAGLVSEETMKAERLRKWLVESWPHAEITNREILQSGPNRLRDGKALAGPISILLKTGHLVQLEPGIVIRGGARKEAYHIVRPTHAV